MGCNFNKELLSSYHDNELDERQKRAVEDHLEICKECKELLADLRATSRIFLSTPRFKAPEWVLKHVESRITKKEKVSWILRYKKVLELGLAGIAIFLIVFNIVYFTGSRLEKAPQPASKEDRKIFDEIDKAGPIKDPGEVETIKLHKTAPLTPKKNRVTPKDRASKKLVRKPDVITPKEKKMAPVTDKPVTDKTEIENYTAKSPPKRSPGLKESATIREEIPQKGFPIYTNESVRVKKELLRFIEDIGYKPILKDGSIIVCIPDMVYGKLADKIYSIQKRERLKKAMPAIPSRAIQEEAGRKRPLNRKELRKLLRELEDSLKEDERGQKLILIHITIIPKPLPK